MKVIPVIKSIIPEYPSENDVKDISGLLNNRKPSKWKRNIAIGTTMTLVTLSCQNEKNNDLKNQITKNYEIKTDSSFLTSTNLNDSSKNNISKKNTTHIHTEIIQTVGLPNPPKVYNFAEQTKAFIINNKEFTLVNKEFYKNLLLNNKSQILSVNRIYVYYVDDDRYSLNISLSNINDTNYCCINLLKIDDTTFVKKEYNSDELLIYDKIHSNTNNFSDAIISDIFTFIKNFKNKKKHIKNALYTSFDYSMQL